MRLTVDLADHPYDIHITPGLIDDAGSAMLSLMSGRRVFIVTDDNVAPLYLARLCASLEAAGLSHAHMILPHGEATKSFSHLERLLEAMLDARCDRSTMLVALGGGVVGDLTGFAASIFLRGIDFIQIPTTLLAQVDSSVGGKTGINTHHGKNLVGSFHQPRLVLIDTTTLASLPRRQTLSGYAEIVKYGCIDEPGFFSWLEGQGRELILGHEATVRQAIAVCCRAKARIVAADERETGVRALLNLGHTFGHALEAEVGFSDEILHGEAVALGMLMAFRLSARLGFAPASEEARLEAHLSSVGLPTRLPPQRGWEVEHLIHHMAGDKKVKEGRITFILASAIGTSFISHQVPVEEVRDVLEAFGAVKGP